MSKIVKFIKFLMLNGSKNLLKANNLLQIQKRATTSKMAKYELKKVELSVDTPLEDYKKLLQQNVQVDDFVDDDILDKNFQLIADAARETIWKLLFEKAPLTPENSEKACSLLEVYKGDAGFHSPYAYNDWIKAVRDELLKREMFDFWRNCIVKKELGPCWARDSDLFDDMDDPEPAAFYCHAGCVAPFGSNDKIVNIEELSPPEPIAITSSPAPPGQISLATPHADYSRKINYQNSHDCDDDEAFRKIFHEAREVLHKLLFSEDELSRENFEKASDLLQAYKQDSCFILPHDYNDWIVKFRDELFERKRFEFWQKVIVERKCGLCCFQDSDHFDDVEDTKPLEFYKSGDEIMKNK